MMLEDLDYRDSIIAYIKDNMVCSAYAVNEVAKQFAQIFSEMDDEYMRARAVDVKDVSQRVIAILLCLPTDKCTLDRPRILAKDDFTPSETANFEKDKVLGLITSGGSKNSHTAIFARTLAIPSVINLGESLKKEYDNEIVILDGETGEVIIAPDEHVLKEKEARKSELEQEQNALKLFVGKKTVTKAGREIKLYANIGSTADVKAVLENDAEGIGLFRSEFLFLESSNYPDEDIQFNAYKQVAQQMGKKPVIIRTLDIGADKQVDYFDLPKEQNPALGFRAIRICLKEKDVFKTQLRALYRASVFGNIHIMLPMINSLEEILSAKNVIDEVKEELSNENLSYSADVSLGIMVETPAAAIISDVLAKEVDFFSIGTNDLIQYTLAVDRQNENVSEFCNMHHDAVLRLIELTAQNAHANGIWVGICGELGADLELYGFYSEIGIDELSVVPSRVLECRKKLSEI